MKLKLKQFQKQAIKLNQAKLVTGATWLPVFTGYYESFFDESSSCIEYETELSEEEYKEYYEELYKAGVTYEFFQSNLGEFVDFSEAFNEASESICYAILDIEHAGIITDIEYEKTVSPKYYNFSTDSINCTITYNVKKLERYISDNLKAYTKHLKDTYTSYDGFSSSYSNNVDDWLDFSDLGEHELGSILQFVIYNEYNGNRGEAALDLYYASNLHEVFSNNRKLDIRGMIDAFNKSLKKAV